MSNIIPTRNLPAQRASTNPALVYLSSLRSANSRRVMHHALAVIADAATNGRCTVETMPWHELRYEHTRAIATLLSEMDYAPATVNRMLAALRRTLQEAWRLGLMSAEDYQRAADLSNIEQVRLPAGRYVSTEEVRAMIAACQRDNTARGVRDAAVIGVLYAGLRRSEIARLQRQHYTPDTGRVEVRAGKHNTDRALYLVDGARLALSDWLAFRGDAPGPLFRATTQRGDVLPSGITAQTVYNIADRRQREAGIVEPLTPHDFRRSAVSDLLGSGVDIATVARMMGHKSTDTTSRYDRRGEEAVQKAVNKRRLPYKESE